MASRNQVLSILSLLVLLSLGCLWGCGGSNASAAIKPPAQTALTISVTAVDFGDVAVGSTSTKPLTISNQSTASVTINALTVTGSGFSMSGATFPKTLTVGSSVTVDLAFAPTGAGSVTGTLVIDSDANITTPTVNMSAAGVPATVPPTLGLSTSSIAFGTINVGSSGSSDVTLTNSSNTTALHVTAATVTGTGYTVHGITLPLTIPASGSQKITVDFTPTAAGGDSGSVVFVSDASNSPTTLTLSGTGALAPATLGVSPTSLAYGTVNVGSTKSLSVTLSNASTTTPITVSSATVSGAGYSVTGKTFPFTIGTSGSTTLTVQFAPTAGGSASGSVVIASDATNPSVTVTLSGTGNLPAGTLGVSPTFLAFGTVTTGTTKSLAVTLSNGSTTTPITVNSATVTGAGYSVTGKTFPFTIAASGSTTMTVRFAPTVAGAASGSVVIASDASNPSVTVTLSGTGALSPATLGVSPTSLAFGTVTTGSTKSLTITLSNASTTTPIKVNSATASGAGYSVTGKTFPFTIGTSGSTTLTVQFAPTAAGAANGSVVIASDASNPSVTVTLTGTGQAPTGALTVSPTSLDFGTVTIGLSLGKSVVLTNNSTSATITVSSATFGGSEYTVSGATFPFTLATGGGNKTLTLTFTPVASGTASDSLSIASNANNSPTVVTVTGIGQAPPSHQVDLSWTASTSTVIGYNVYRSGTTGGPYTMINSTLATPTGYTDTNVVAGSTYYYVVTAVDASNVESDPSNEASGTVPSP